MAAERRVGKAAEIRRGEGFRSHKLVAELGGPIDPFLSIEHFHMTTPTFEPHPHAGMSAITYLFACSPGALVSREVSGAARIAPGAVRWQETARGVVHVEEPLTRDLDCHGVQVLVNLPSAVKRAEPRVFHLEAHEIPEATPAPGVRVRIVGGSFAGVRSPIAPRTPITLLDVHMAPGASFTHALGADEVAFVLALEGSGDVGSAGAAPSIAPEMAAAFARGEIVTACARGESFHLFVAAGCPIDEPVVFEGPLALASREELAETWARFAAGELGSIAPLATAPARTRSGT